MMRHLYQPSMTFASNAYLVRFGLTRTREASLALLLVIILCSGTALGQASPTTSVPPVSAETATFQIEASGLIYLPVTVGDTTRFFVLDSGASLHVLDVSFGSESNVRMGSAKIVTNGPPLSVELRARPEISIGAIRMTDDLPIAVHDFTDISNAVNRPVHGLIGAPCFHDRMICIDLISNLLTIGPCGTETAETWDHMISLRIGNEVFFVDDAFVQDRQISFMLDTGMAGGIALSRKEFDRLIEAGAIVPREESETTTVRGRISRRTGWLREFKLGSLKAETVYVVEAEENKIGLGYLRKKRFRVLIDGRRMQLYIKCLSRE